MGVNLKLNAYLNMVSDTMTYSIMKTINLIIIYTSHFGCKLQLQ